MTNGIKSRGKLPVMAVIALALAVTLIGGAFTSVRIGAQSNSQMTPAAPTSIFMHKTSTHSFDDTVSSLKHAVSDNGMMVLGTLNQAKALSMTGLNLKGAEAFFVGNPVVGKAMFDTDAAAGLELPPRVYVWVDKDGKTQVGYFLPSALLTAINPDLKGAGAKLDSTLAKIVAETVK